jgi:iron(III) transport system substrate-binding protein
MLDTQSGKAAVNPRPCGISRAIARSGFVIVGAILATIVIGGGAEAQQASSEDRIEAARQEGALTIYSNNMATGTFEALSEGFKEEYGLEDHDIQYQHLKSGELIARVDQEIMADSVNADVVQLAALNWYYFDLIPNGRLLEYESPEWEHYDIAKSVGAYEPGYWAGNLYAFTIAYNSQQIQDPPASWDDLLDPALKGKINVGDASKSATYLATYIGLREVLDREYFESLADQEPVIVVSNDQLGQMIADGEYPVGTTIVARVANELAQQGAPIKMVYPEQAVVLLPFPWVILADAPHPESSKLWIDYVSSQEGQTIIAKGDLIFSGRSDVPAPDPDFLPDLSEANVVNLDWEQALTPENEEKFRKEWTEIFIEGQ